jgi:DNA-binding IclR family transcriptional regulator
VPEPGPSVTSRAFAILAAFTPQHDRLALTEIAHRTGVPLSTAHRLVAELTRLGALERNEDGRYRIGLRIWEIGVLAPRALPLRDSAMPFLQDIHQATGQNVQLAVMDGANAVYVERILGRASVRIVTRVGSRLPLHATGVGLVLLAFAPLSVRQEMLAAPLRRFTSHTVTDPADLRHILDEVRHNGFSICDRQIEDVSLSVAAPIFDRHNDVVAAVSVVVAARLRPAEFVPVVVSAARGISRSLGAQLRGQPRLRSS